MILERAIICSLSNPHSIYFRIAVIPVFYANSLLRGVLDLGSDGSPCLGLCCSKSQELLAILVRTPTTMLNSWHGPITWVALDDS